MTISKPSNYGQSFFEFGQKLLLQLSGKTRQLLNTCLSDPGQRTNRISIEIENCKKGQCCKVIDHGEKPWLWPTLNNGA